MFLTKLKKQLQKEAYLLPIIVCLFLVPLFFNPFFINSFTQGKELLMKFVLLISLTGISIYWMLRGKFKLKQLHQSPVFLWVSIGALFMAGSTALSPTPLIPLYGSYSRGFGIFTQVYLLTFVIYCAWVVTEKNVRKLLQYAFISSVIVAAYGLGQKLGFDPLFHNYSKDIFVGRIFSSMGNPGYLGQYMMLNFILGIFFIVQQKERAKKIWYSLGTVLIFAALWFSQTRTSLVALVVCALLSAIKYRKNILKVVKNLTKNQKVFAVISAIALVTVLVFLPKDRFSFDDEATRSLNSRFEIWKGAVNLIEQKPWFGYGQDTFSIYSPQIITKQFLTLEEDLNLAIDRIHNELLETVFSYGIFAGIAYVCFFLFLILKFLKTKTPWSALFALLIIANIIQNQFSFSDIAISIFISFCLGALIADEISKQKDAPIQLSKYLKLGGIIFVIMLSFGGCLETIYKPFLSQLAYAESHKNYDTSYDVAVNEHKNATRYAPYANELWYELMFLDPSSMERALQNIERIEGRSGNLLAWYGNYYAEKDPSKASEYYLEALEKNPYYPNWIRSYADMLYKNGDYENALALYTTYLEDAVPDFWKWRATLDQHTQKERTSYRIFFKNAPDFWKTVDRVNILEQALKLKGEKISS